MATERVYLGILSQDQDGIRAYHKSYYVTWKPVYDEYALASARMRGSAQFPQFAWVRALITQIIYEQPVVHEFALLRTPTLLVIGHKDRTAFGKARVGPEVRATLGPYPELGRRARAAIPDSRLIELPEVGHVPHLEAPDRFQDALLGFLRQ